MIQISAKISRLTTIPTLSDVTASVSFAGKVSTFVQTNTIPMGGRKNDDDHEENHRRGRPTN